MDFFFQLWPGIYVAALAAVMGYALARWYEPVGKRAWVVCALLVAILLGPTLVGNATLGPLDKLTLWPPFDGDEELEAIDSKGHNLQNDVLEELLPWLLVTRDTWRAGELPMWNPFSGLGTPLLANPQTFALHPFLLLSLAVPDVAALPTIAALRLLTIFVFCLLFARRTKMGETPALFFATTFTLSGFVMHWLVWPHVNSVAMTCLGMYALTYWLQTRNRRGWVLLTLALALLVISGHPETILHGLVLLVMVGLCNWFAVLRHDLKGPHSFRSAKALPVAAWATASGLTAVALVSPVLSATADYLPEMKRYQEMELRKERVVSTATTTGHVVRNLALFPKRVLPVIAPNAYGSSRHKSYWGFVNSNEAATGFAGSVVLLLGLLSVTKRHQRGATENAVILAGLVAAVLVAHPPGLSEVLVRLPLFDSSPLYHRRMLWVLAFAACFVAAKAIDRASCPTRATVRVSRLRVWTLATLVITSVLATYWLNPPPAEVDQLATQRGMWAVAQCAAVLAAATALTFMRQHSGKVLLVAAALELLLFHQPLNPPVDSRLFYPHSPIIDRLHNVAQDRPGARLIGIGASMPPEMSSAYGLRDIRASGPSIPASLLPLYKELGSASLYRDLNPKHSLLDLLGVTHMIGRRGALPRRGVARTATSVLWSRKTALPPLFLPNASEHWNLRQNPDLEHHDFSSLSWVFERQTDHAKLQLAGPERWQAKQPAELEVLEVGRSSIKARYRSTEPRLMASSIYDDGHWQVFLAEQALPTVRVNGPLVGAWLPAAQEGAEVLLRYRAGGLPRKWTLTLGLIAFSVLGGWRRPTLPLESVED